MSYLFVNIKSDCVCKSSQFFAKLKMAKSTTFQHIVVDNKKMVAFDFLTNKKVQEEIFFTS